MYLEPSKDHCGRSEREEGWEESVLVLFLTFCETVSETVSEIERLREGEGGRERGEKILEMYSMYNTHHVHECICRHTVWVIKKFPFRLRGTVFQRYYALRFRTVSVFIISVLLILTRSTCERTGRCETDNGRCGKDNGRCGTDDSRGSSPPSGKRRLC